MLPFIFVALLVAGQTQVAAQNQNRVFSEASSSSSFSSSSSSSRVSASAKTTSELQDQLQSAAETALSTLSSNPDANLNAVLQQLAQVVLTEIGQLFVTLFKGRAASIDASAVAQEISSAVGGAISVAASSGSSSSFADIDIDTLQSTIQSSVKDRLSGVGQDADVRLVATEVARGVLNAMGDALAEATGQSFTFELSVKGSQSDGEATSASVSTQSQFESSFSAEAQQALATLEANPDDLSTVIQQIATIIITSIQKLFMNISSVSETEGSEFSLAISTTIKNLLTSLAASSSIYANIDVEGTTSSIQSQLKRIFSQSASRTNINVQTLANQVASAVAANVGPALAQASGADFSFSIGLGETSSQTTSSQTAVTIQGLSEFETEIQSAFQNAFDKFDGSTNNIEIVFQTMSNQFLLHLGNIMTTIVNTANTDAKEISITITTAIQQALSAAVSSSPKFEKLNISNITSNIQISLDDIFTNINIGDMNNADADKLTQNVASAILTPIAEAFSDITGTYNWYFYMNADSTPASIVTVKTGTAEASAPSSVSVPSTSGDASSRSVQLQVSSEIVSSLKNTDEAIKLIREAADKQQTIAISAAFLQAIEEGSDADLSKVLILFFTDSQVPSSTIALILTLTISGGNQKALNLLTKTMKETSDLSKLSAVFKFAFTTKDSDVTDAFSTLVSSSVQNNKCDLSKVISAALKGATPEEVEQITSAFEKVDAQVCIPTEYTSTTSTGTSSAKPAPKTTNEAAPLSGPSTAVGVTKGGDTCDCGCEDLISKMVKDIVLQVLAEIQP